MAQFTFILLCNYKIRLKKLVRRISQTSLMEGPAGLMTEWWNCEKKWGQGGKEWWEWVRKREKARENESESERGRRMDRWETAQWNEASRTEEEEGHREIEEWEWQMGRGDKRKCKRKRDGWQENTQTHSRIEDTQVKCDKTFSMEARGGCWRRSGRRRGHVDTGTKMMNQVR